ncbi:MAG TPA: glycosyltransferase family 39 protein, partial [Acidimicrobiales bacterium]
MALTDVDPGGSRRLTAVEPRRGRWAGSDRVLHRLLVVIIAIASTIGVALFGVSRGELWLDEAQSVAIARLPIEDLFDALREDGAPPLYYLVLHGWIRLFGEGTFAVRSLSGVFAVAAVPTMWFLARRIGGRSVAWSATVLLATSPFLI